MAIPLGLRPTRIVAITCFVAVLMADTELPDPWPLRIG
jgi:hypothetical protein